MILVAVAKKIVLGGGLIACVFLDGSNIFAQSLPVHEALARQLLGEDVDDARRNQALIQSRDILYGVEDALILALEQQGELGLIHDKLVRNGEESTIQINPDFLARLTEVVITLRNPGAIPGLISVLGTGSTATPVALAAFGEEAVPGLVSVITPPAGASHQVYDALLSLRCMVDSGVIKTFSSASVDEITRVIEQRLNMKQEFVTNLWRDIDLAIALGDPQLKSLVEKLSLGEGELRARGINEQNLIQKTQTLAKERMAGVQALPTCDVFEERINDRFGQ